MNFIRKTKHKALSQQTLKKLSETLIFTHELFAKIICDPFANLI
ncbi:hypothetical protein GVAMD_0905 [Gardnerella vaginalis AMD]|nr:hypothetical protein GVAMD_0905 [Gardnerella vaginalis AMD]